MTLNGTIIGQVSSQAKMGATVNYGTASCYAGANSSSLYHYILKFKTPAFAGVFEKLNINLRIKTQWAASMTLRYALATSDANKTKYAQLTGTVTDEYQIDSGTFVLPSSTSYAVQTLSLSTEVQPNTEYYLYLWAYNRSCLTQLDVATAHSIEVEYTAQTYIDSISDTALGEAVTVKFTPPSASFAYEIEFSTGDWRMTTGIFSPNTTAQYTHTEVIPLGAAYQIPTAIGTMTATLYSYLSADDLTQIGEPDSVDFKVVVPEDETKPVVDMVLSVISDLASPFNEMYIQNLTKVDADIFAYGQYGASIEAQQLVLGGAVYEDPFVTDILTTTGETAVTAKATDSRGYVGKMEQKVYVIPYGKPALVPADGETNIVCCRCDALGNITDSGTYLKIKAKRSYSPVMSNGKQYNFCTIRYRCDGGAWHTILAGNASGDEVDVVIPNVVTSTTSAYTIEVGVVDDIGKEASAIIIVPSDSVEFHLREGGNGAAFGEYAEDANVLAVAESWELRVKGTMTIGGKSLLDMFYPVGSIYMSVNSTNPATFFGGNWERISSTAFADYIWKRV